MTDPKPNPVLQDMNQPEAVSPGFHGFASPEDYQRAKFDQAREILGRQDALEHIIIERTGRILSVHPELQYLNNPFIGAVTNNRGPNDPEGINWDELADFGELEARSMMHFADYYGGVPEFIEYPNKQRLPVDMNGDAIYKYHMPTMPGGYPDNGRQAKAIAKRRKANKAARKARRK